MLSIIIPVYNEEKIIKKLLNDFSYQPTFEVIVVDGGSRDRTVEFSAEYPVKLIQSARNRALQLNEGAKSARGDIFLFLHADCHIDNDSLWIIENRLNDSYIGGCFEQRIISQRLTYRLIEASGNLRAKLFKIFYGDQAIFVRKEIFQQIGGFDKVELFDDIIFSKKLKRLGKICVLNKKVYTSDRRWQKQGIIKTILINWLLTIGFLMGIPHHLLKKMYQDIR